MNFGVHDQIQIEVKWYRPAGQATKTAPDTASVDVNGPAVNAANNGKPLKLKFPPTP